MTAREALIAFENDLVTAEEAIEETHASDLDDLYDMAATERVENVASFVRQEFLAAPAA